MDNTGPTNIPKNFFLKSVFEGAVGLTEKHEFEQFFWTRSVVDRILSSIGYQYQEEICCFTTPSVAHQLHVDGRDETLLDIDRRFEYLPKFRYYDARSPHPLTETYRILIIDPPFFIIPIEEIRKAVDVITKGDYNTKILIAYIKRNEHRLLTAFKDYKMYPTTFPLEYVSVKPNKWGNFVLYSNIELPGIKKIKNRF